ncbi:nucleotidyltransferase substrate binding protein [uncultured Treponema sp.]|uniref:nucleotidyltransferase substrate binding protein n=1 Tax=uncultured Treponema sp. TaxID=162155 RepID=UPI002633F8DC|nr:nucleotidyltransferase substrate binding protein [uncultured Treponema sp.]
MKNKGAASQIIGSKDAIRNAYSVGLIKNDDIWMDMIASRNLSSHAYDEDSVQQIIDKCVLDYHKEFLNLKETLEKNL